MKQQLPSKRNPETNFKSVSHLAERLSKGRQIIFSSEDVTRIDIPALLPLRSGQRLILADDARQANPDPVLIAALRKAHRMVPR